MGVFRLLRRVSFIFLASLSLATKSQQQGAGQEGAVTSEVDVCSKIGILLLRDGGNAADAVSDYTPECILVTDLNFRLSELQYALVS